MLFRSTVSAIKAGYAQLQHAQSPYEAEGIQAADQLVVSDFEEIVRIEAVFFKETV